jgi:hypothetical protein
MARLAYAAVGCAGSRGWCNPWWAIDYPLAEAHFLPAVERMTRVQVAPDSKHVTLADDTLFDYPWLFLQQPGRGDWHPQGAEAERLREYLERGGSSSSTTSTASTSGRRSSPRCATCCRTA